jgi:hypothetical protein
MTARPSPRGARTRLGEDLLAQDVGVAAVLSEPVEARGDVGPVLVDERFELREEGSVEDGPGGGLGLRRA